MRWIGALLFAAAALFAPPGAARDVPSTIAEVRLDDLPVEARQTLARIKRGGPYEYRKDGSVFGNREKRLPAQPRGYYTEYTVRTPYSRDRGARRIVAGRGAERDPATSGEYYYTDDHYNSFRRILE
jgi:ribonuclease T1